MNTLQKLSGHFNTITTHKLLVMKLCFKMGLYSQGLLHDNSKYSPVEFISGVRYYQGDKSPIVAEIRDRGYSEGWLHHKGHNKHHWQYWITVKRGHLEPLEMPLRYIKEMTCDRIAACMVYEKEKYTDASALAFLENSEERKLMPEHTYQTLRKYLTWVRDLGIDKAFEMIRKDDGN